MATSQTIVSNWPSNELFRGREGKNNERIMGLLSRRAMNQYQIAKELGKKYTTIFDRLRDLERKNIIKVVGETEAKKSHNSIALYGLASLGVYAAIFQSRNKQLQRHGLTICSRMFVRLWEDFANLYKLDAKQSVIFKNWIGSDQGVVFMLRQFGHSFLDRDYHVLLVFRRMIDLSVFLMEWQFMSALILFTFPGQENTVVSRAEQPTRIKTAQEAMMVLGTIAYSHPKLRKLCDVMKESDAPLLKEIERIAKEERNTILNAEQTGREARRQIA